MYYRDKKIKKEINSIMHGVLTVDGIIDVLKHYTHRIKIVDLFPLIKPMDSNKIDIEIKKNPIKIQIKDLAEFVDKFPYIKTDAFQVAYLEIQDNLIVDQAILMHKKNANNLLQILKKTVAKNQHKYLPHLSAKSLKKLSLKIDELLLAVRI